MLVGEPQRFPARIGEPGLQHLLVPRDADRTTGPHSGRYVDRFTDTTAHEQAHDPAARARSAAVTRALIV
ncbi:hypothetical protein ACNPQM_34040 [Streptomyces sp. NPDC056231]|uniref:hypothetical protein n=1 Tax=Streptomyces sp. NPDC056231 TaxID=3345755 RepID=UPI003AACC041